MAYAFDTLGYAKRLQEAGVTTAEAEAHAEAARDFIMAELVTKQDLDLRFRLSDEALQHRLDTLELRLLVRLGGLIAVGIAILAAVIKL